jgi:Golgi nucleoside diphosphatase
MNNRQCSDRSAELKTELFGTLYRLKNIQAELQSRAMRASDLDDAISALSAGYDMLSACDLVIDAARDPKDRNFKD